GDWGGADQRRGHEGRVCGDRAPDAGTGRAGCFGPGRDRGFHARRVERHQELPRREREQDERRAGRVRGGFGNFPRHGARDSGRAFGAPRQLTVQPAPNASPFGGGWGAVSPRNMAIVWRFSSPPSSTLCEPTKDGVPPRRQWSVRPERSLRQPSSSSWLAVRSVLSGLPIAFPTEGRWK